jgi:hypothetical protein
VVVGDDCRLDLRRLAQEICRRYRQEFPDEQERYGDAGQEWCVHDNQHLLSWAAGEVNGHLELVTQVAWLAKVLEARGFPLDRLARNLDIGAEVARTHVDEGVGGRLAEVLARAAEHVRQHETFLD